MITAIVGANWGDEGKGKITDGLAGESDFVVRYQGGANAGHTIINDYGRFALHLLPSGVFHQHITNIIGNGVAFNMRAFTKELNDLVAQHVPMPRLAISNRAQVMMPYHILLDEYEEERLSNKKFGSTKSGIAPFYSDKYAKIGFQVSELFDKDRFIEKLNSVLEVKNVLVEHLYHKPKLNAADIAEEVLDAFELIRPYVQDTQDILYQAVKADKAILLEGQLGALKDPDFGIYPMVTSSSTLAGYGCMGAGVPPYVINRIVAVVKAYSSAVGAGAFVSEIFGDEADELRKRGGDKGEFGATTGRPRRIGWFDAVASRYGCKVQGATEAVVTIVDALGYLDEIPVCIGYEIDGKITRDFPVTEQLERAKPILERLPGWKTDIRGARTYADLPQNAKNYIEFIEKELQVPVTTVSTGPNREDICKR